MKQSSLEILEFEAQTPNQTEYRCKKQRKLDLLLVSLDSVALYEKRVQSLIEQIMKTVTKTINYSIGGEYNE